MSRAFGPYDHAHEASDLGLELLWVLARPVDATRASDRQLVRLHIEQMQAPGTLPTSSCASGVACPSRSRRAKSMRPGLVLTRIGKSIRIDPSAPSALQALPRAVVTSSGTSFAASMSSESARRLSRAIGKSSSGALTRGRCNPLGFDRRDTAAGLEAHEPERGHSLRAALKPSWLACRRSSTAAIVVPKRPRKLSMKLSKSDRLTPCSAREPSSVSVIWLSTAVIVLLAQLVRRVGDDSYCYRSRGRDRPTGSRRRTIEHQRREHRGSPLTQTAAPRRRASSGRAPLPGRARARVVVERSPSPPPTAVAGGGW